MAGYDFEERGIIRFARAINFLDGLNYITWHRALSVKFHEMYAY